MRRPLLTILIIMSVTLIALSQNKPKIKTDPNGAVKAGYSIIDEMLPEGYYYNPQTFLASIDIWKRKKFSIYSELQLVQAYDSFNREADYEFGVNLGFMFSQKLSRHLILTAAIGSGPHYITVDTRSQAKGFIFSDNLELGLVYKFFKLNTRLNLKFRYRHISNAGLQTPNWGIDNLFLVLGIARNISSSPI